MATDRTVSVVQEEVADLLTPTVEAVKMLNKTVVTDGEHDAFKTKAEVLHKQATGVHPNTKRRMSTMEKKFEGVGGAESKQIKDKEFLSGYDAFDVVEPPYNLDYLTKLYEMSSAHYAAVNAKVSNIVGLGYKFVETRKTKRSLEKVADNEAKQKKLRQTLDEHLDQLLEDIESFNKEDTFTEVLVKVWRDYEVTGNGYIEIGRKRDGSIGYIGHIPAKTLRIRRARDGFVQMSGFNVAFFANYGAGVDDDGNKVPIKNPVGKGTPNEVIHLKKYSPASGFYGVPDIVPAIAAIVGNEFASRFNLDYFENKAIPRHVIVLKGAKLSAGAETNLLRFFETSLKGQNHRSMFIPLPASTKDNPVDIEFKDIAASVQDASFENYRRANLNDILMAHRVFITKVSVSENVALALAKDADKTFKEQVCAPEQGTLEMKLNRVVKELTDAFELDLNEMSLTDADTQSTIDERDVKAGIILPNEVRTTRGLPGIEGGNERVDLNAKAKDAAAQARDSATPRARDSQRSAGATDSRGAARNPKGDGRSTP